MKIIERKIVNKNRYGKIIFNNYGLEEPEKETIFYLVKFGFDIEILKPSNIPKSKNPDLLMLGTTWEIKSPQKFNRATIQTKFRKAVKQSGGRGIFDLRNVNSEEAELYIMKLFLSTREMKRIMIIQEDGQLLDIFK